MTTENTNRPMICGRRPGVLAARPAEGPAAAAPRPATRNAVPSLVDGVLAQLHVAGQRDQAAKTRAMMPTGRLT